MTTDTLTNAVRRAVAAVDDPEFPGLSIVDLGIVEDLRLDPDAASVEVDLVPTFLGCPALEVIRGDVRAAIEAVPGVGSADVRFVGKPLWSPDRITARGRKLLAESFTVAVPGSGGEAGCPVCSAQRVETLSPFGPTACRAIAYCSSCLNPVEVMRR